MIADDLQELYKLLRGSRSAISILDARALVQENKHVAARVKVIDARESYLESRSRLMRQDPAKQYSGTTKEDQRNRKTLMRKQEKTREILKAFDELMPTIERLANRQQASEAAEAAEAVEPSDPATEAMVLLATSADVSKSLIESFHACDSDGQLDVINAVFGFREVDSGDDIYPNAVYFIRNGSRNFLVATTSTLTRDDSVELTSLVDDRPIKAFKRESFVRLGKKRKMVLLTKTLAVNDDDGLSDNASDSQEDSGDGEQRVLDMGAFGQLMSAAQRSGLVSGADQIGHVRDREFRLEKYDLAFQTIDAIYSRFTAEANQRSQHLVREDADISSGRLKISPKDLQAKRTRDRMQTQEIERARRRFQVVLEGLRRLTAGVAAKP